MSTNGGSVDPTGESRAEFALALLDAPLNVTNLILDVVLTPQEHREIALAFFLFATPEAKKRVELEGESCHASSSFRGLPSGRFLAIRE